MIDKLEQQLTNALHRLDSDGRPLPHRPWQRWLSRAVRMLVPAPHQASWMEWEYGTWVGMFAAYDQGGRQLGEANVLPEWLATPLDDHWRPFKGAGIRHGHPFNVDAMHEMAQCWDGLLQDAAALRVLYCQRYGRSGQLSALDLYLITTVAVSLSAFLLRRADAAVPNGDLPRQVAAAFKVIGGMYAATNRMMSQAHPMLLQDSLDPEVFLQYLEDERLLLSPEMRACGGPVKMIRQMLTTLITPGVGDGQAGLGYLGADVGRAFDYGVACARIDMAVLLHWRALGQTLWPLLEREGIPAPVRAALLAEPELGVEDPMSLRAYVAVVARLQERLGTKPWEQAFMAALPVEPHEQASYRLGTMAEVCSRLEKAMHDFSVAQQVELGQILRRKPCGLKKGQWSPAPGSAFLKQLLRDVPVLAGAFKGYG